jgi:hypothetical protein
MMQRTNNKQSKRTNRKSQRRNVKNNNNNNNSTSSRVQTASSSASWGSGSLNYGMSWIGNTVPPRLTQSDNQIYTIQQDLQSTFFSQSSSGASIGASGFEFLYLDQYATLQAVFDQYRVDALEFTFRPTFTANSLTTALGGSFIPPNLYTVIDYDDLTIPSGLAALRECSNCTTSLYETVVRRFKPHIAVAAFNSSFTSSMNVAAPWIDTASANVIHYGVKYGTEPASITNDLQIWSVIGRVQISFRNVK